MTEALANQQPYPASRDETLLEFLYLTPVGIVKFRPDGRIDMANPTAARLLIPLAPAPDMSDLYCLLSTVMPDLPNRIEAFRAPTGAIFDQLQLTSPNGPTVLTLSVNKIDPDTFMAVIQDITRAIEQDTRLRDDQQRFRAIVENVRDYAIYTADLDGRVDTWNQSLARIGGWQATDVMGEFIGLFYPAESAQQAQWVSLLDRARQHGTAESEGWRVRKDRSRFWGNTVAASLPDAFGRPGGYVLVTRDLTERKQMEDRLITLSVTDPMTGALNRRAAESKLAEVFRGWQRYRRIFSLLMIDCDHFKTINDRWGHDAGDDVLISLVRICRDYLRDSDAIFRWGGEEFLVLLPEAGGEAVGIVAERLRLGLEATAIVHAEAEIRITVSIGVAEVSAADNSPGDVVRRVDTALYAAKNGGRNKIIIGDGSAAQRPVSMRAQK
jgi:diguanylate cyclase (GGDEF)-like protein/PAS domain S-box-containing protein